MSYVTQQESLNKLVTDKIAKMADANKNGIQSALTKLIDESKVARDFVAPIGVNLQNEGSKPVVTFDANGSVNMTVHKHEPETFTLHENAVGQLGEKLNIPTRYLKTLVSGDEWQRQLAQRIMNEHSNWTDRNRVLVRVVGNQVRGVLSDQYRRLNSQQILGGFFEAIEQNGGWLTDGYMNDTKMWFEALYPQPIEIMTPKNGLVVVAFGVRIASSDYGASALEMRSMMLNGACLNGWVRESILRQVHLGSRLPDNLTLSNRTYQLDTETQKSAVIDLTGKLFSRETFENHKAAIEAVSGQEINLTNELKMLAKGKLQKDEVEEVTQVVTNGKQEDGVTGENTLWKLVNGITAVARTAEPERKRDLQEIAGSLMQRVEK